MYYMHYIFSNFQFAVKKANIALYHEIASEPTGKCQAGQAEIRFAKWNRTLEGNFAMLSRASLFSKRWDATFADVAEIGISEDTSQSQFPDFSHKTQTIKKLVDINH